MKRPGIESRILLVALAPAIVLSLVLIVYFARLQLDLYEESLLKRAHAFSHEISNLAEYGAWSGNFEYLEDYNLLSGHMFDPSITAILVYDLNGKIMVTRATDSFSTELVPPPPTNNSADFLFFDHYLAYFHPIVELGSTANNLHQGGIRMQVEEQRTLGWVSVVQDLHDYQNQRETIFTRAFILIGLIMLAAVMLALRIARKLTRPLAELIQVTRQMANGDFDTRTKVEGDGEIAELQGGINQMADSLSSAHRQLEKRIEQVNAELLSSYRQIEESEKKYRELVENAHSIILKIDLNGTITFINEFAEKVFRYSVNEVMGKPATGTLILAEHAHLMRNILANPEKTATMDSAHATRSGQRIYIRWSVHPIRDQNHAVIGIIGVGLDITEQHRIARAIELVSYAGTGTNTLYTDLVSAILIGTDAKVAGIYQISPDKRYATVLSQRQLGETQELFSFVVGNSVFSEIVQTAQPVFVQEEFQATYKDNPPFPVRGLQSFFGMPVFEEDGSICAVIFCADYQGSTSETPDRALFNLIAKRIVFEYVRRRSEVQTESARDNALQASRAKSQFIANVSHEVRTPLNGVIGFVELLKGTQLDLKQAEFVDTIHRSSINLLEIINDVLDLSKIESGKLNLAEHEFDLPECFEDVISLFVPRAKEKALEFLFHFAPDIPQFVVADSVRIKQVLFNLIGNAVKFTDQGTVLVRVTHQAIHGNRIKLITQITDTGTGIAQEDQTRLFSAFTQLEDAVTKTREGTGLGLVISKSLVELMHGDISLQSTPGVGTSITFTAQFPIGPHAVPNEFLPFFGLQTLLFDSFLDSRESTQHVLERSGFRVTATDFFSTYANTETAWKSLIRHYDLIWVDQNCLSNSKQGLSTLLAAAKSMQKPTVFSSQLDSKQRPDLARDRFDIAFQKPITQRGILTQLKSVLQTASPQSSPQSLSRSLDRNAPLADAANYRVLLVDDNEVSRILVKTVLGDQGAVVVEAHNGHEAVKLAGQEHYDLILMDIHMPGISGVEAARLIRKESPYNAETAIIAMTANIQYDHAPDAGEHDFDEYLIKPVTESQINNIVRKWAAQSSQPDQPDYDSQTIDIRAKSAPPVFDLEAANRVSGGNHVMVRKMFELLKKELPEHKSTINNLYAKNGISIELRDAVHKLHGAAAYCGVPALKRSALDLELALRDEDKKATVILVNQLNIEIDRVYNFDLEIAMPA